MSRKAKNPLLGSVAVAGAKNAAIVFLLIGLISTSWGLSAFAQTQRSPGSRELSRDEDRVIVSLHQEIGELAEQDPTPMLRIYKNGRVHVYFPRYMKRAGHYMLHLSEYELEGLLRSLASKGLMEFNVEEAQLEKKRRDEGRMEEVLVGGGQPTLYYTTEDTKTVIDINVENYRPRGSRRSLHVRKKIVWNNIEWDAKRYPDVKAIQNLAAATRELKALTEREDLLKLYNN